MPNQLTVRDVHILDLGWRPAPIFVRRNFLVVVEQGLIFEPRAVLHLDVQAEDRMRSDKALAADVYFADVQIAVLDTVAEQLGVESDTGIVTDLDAVPDRTFGRADRAVAADLGSHQPIKPGHDRRAGEHAHAAEAVQAGHEPPAHVIFAPQRIRPRLVAPDDEPFPDNAEGQDRRPDGEDEEAEI